MSVEAAAQALRCSPDLVDRLNYRIGLELSLFASEDRALKYREGRLEREREGTPSDADLISDACTEIKKLRRRILWMQTEGNDNIPEHLLIPGLD